MMKGDVYGDKKSMKRCMESRDSALQRAGQLVSGESGGRVWVSAWGEGHTLAASRHRGMAFWGWMNI